MLVPLGGNWATTSKGGASAGRSRAVTMPVNRVRARPELIAGVAADYPSWRCCPDGGVSGMPPLSDAFWTS